VKRLAAASPIPALPPVTTATFPSSFLVMASSSFDEAANRDAPQFDPFEKYG
jgi:hypothetical protein